MSRNPNLNGFLYFETVARRGTISRAAEEMSVSPSAVSQQIKLLEQQLGVKLFRRQGRLLSLTLEGEQLFQTSTAALRMLRDAQRHFGKTRETYELNMRVTPSFGARWLGPRLSDFVNRYPDWDLRVDAAPDPTDFDREMMELEIRYGVGNYPGYHVEPIFDDRVLPLCSPEFLAGLEPKESLGAFLDQARLIRTPRALYQWEHWLHFNGIDLSSMHMSILMDRSSMALELAKDGVGIVLDSMALAVPEIAEGKLVPALPQIPVVKFPSYWAICPARYLSRRAVQLFLDWFKGEAARFEGDVAAIYKSYGLTEVEIELDAHLYDAGRRSSPKSPKH